MTNELREQGRLVEEDRELAHSSHRGRPLRRMNEPLFTGADVAAFVVALIMVCGPLAMGVFRL